MVREGRDIAGIDEHMIVKGAADEGRRERRARRCLE
jgi:hypothetical protein